MNIRRTIHHGGGGLRWVYNRHLAQGLAVSVLAHVVLIGSYVLFGSAPDGGMTSGVRLPSLPVPQYDTTMIPMRLTKLNVRSGGGGGSPEVDKPLGAAKKGLRDAAPKLDEKAPSKEGRAVSKNPTKITVAKEPKNDPVPTTSRRDSANERSANYGRSGQHPDGTGEKLAGGSGGTGVGTGTGGGVGVGDGGLGGRGWIRRPSAKYPSGANASGQVVLSFTVLPNGTVTNVVPVRKADPALVQAAIASLKSAKAQPLPEDVPQIPQSGKIPYTFSLKE